MNAIVRVLPLLLAATWAAGAGAYDRLDQLGPGTRLRVSLLDVDAWGTVGSLVAVDKDTLFMESQHKPLALPFPRLGRVDQSLGKHRNVVKWGLIGLLIGGIASTAVERHEDPNAVLDLSELSVVYTRLLLIAGGTTGGLVVGYLVKTDIWERVETPPYQE